QSRNSYAGSSTESEGPTPPCGPVCLSRETPYRWLNTIRPPRRGPIRKPSLTARSLSRLRRGVIPQQRALPLGCFGPTTPTRAPWFTLALWRLDRVWCCRTLSQPNDCHSRPVNAYRPPTPPGNNPEGRPQPLSPRNVSRWGDASAGPRTAPGRRDRIAPHPSG